MLLALDPSIRSCGIALFNNEKELTLSERVINYDLKNSIPRRVMTMGNQIVYKVQRIGIQEFVSEWPQIYQSVKAKGDPNDLIAMAAVVAAVGAGLKLIPTTYLPYEWCGRLPKAIKGDVKQSVRAQRILSKLTVDEQKCVVSSHDAIDAIGIGLHYFNRLHKV